MQCPVCWASLSGFIGSDCNCGGSRPDPVPDDAVTVDGMPVTHDGEVVVHTSE